MCGLLRVVNGMSEIDRQSAILAFADMRDGYPRFTGELYRDIDIKKVLEKLSSVQSKLVENSKELGKNSKELGNKNAELISREEVLKLPQRKGYAVNGWETYIRVSDIKELPSVQPKTQKLLDDGTLIVHTDIDITKITRVNITQNNAHYGDLFYRDEE